MARFNHLDVEIITLNCQGLRTPDHRDTLFSWLRCCKVDIVCLQETHTISRQEFDLWVASASAASLNTTGYKSVSSPGANRSCGVAILYHPKYELISWSGDRDGRFAQCELSPDECHLQICNIYGPNRAKEGSVFFQSLGALIDPDTPTVLCGDFNGVVDAQLDRLGCNPDYRWAYNWPSSLVDLIASLDLHDGWRLHHPATKTYTWHRPNGT